MKKALAVPNDLAARLKLEQLAESCADDYRDFLLCLVAHLLPERSQAAKKPARRRPATKKPPARRGRKEMHRGKGYS
jgi:hypothetical protein